MDRVGTVSLAGAFLSVKVYGPDTRPPYTTS
jgi:hypothetical protein